MLNKKEIFNEIAYSYYPKNMYEFDKKFLLTNESKRLINKINSFNEFKFNELLHKIDEEFIENNVIKFKIKNNNPSYIIQIDLKLDKKNKSVLIIYLSYLIPYYTLAPLNGDFLKKTIKTDIALKRQNLKLVEKVKMIISKQIKYKEFANDILNDNIPFIKVKENFSHFNAFFSDYHRIINF